MEASWKNEPYKSGVILPYFWNKKEKACYFLIANDRPKANQYGKYCWSAFGGYRKEDEVCPKKTAIREAIEESGELLAKLAELLENDKAVTFNIGDKHYVYVINLSVYKAQEIYSFHIEFDKALRAPDLSQEQKEKTRLGWIKASDVPDTLNLSKFTVLKQPYSTSEKISTKGVWRDCQLQFWKKVIDTDIAGCWHGLKGKVVKFPGYEAVTKPMIKTSRIPKNQNWKNNSPPNNVNNTNDANVGKPVPSISVKPGVYVPPFLRKLMENENTVNPGAEKVDETKPEPYCPPLNNVKAKPWHR